MDSDKLKKDLAKKGKALKISYNRRKQSLFKKGYELATLCGIDLCVIVCDPKQGVEHVKPETWPIDPQQVKRIIRKYQRKEQEKRSFVRIPENSESKQDLNVVAKVSDSRKKSRITKYPLWDDRLNGYSEDELEQLLGRLDAKLEDAEEKINMLKDKQLVMLTDKHQGEDELDLGLQLFPRTENVVDKLDLKLELFPRSQNLVDNVQGYQQQNNNNICSSKEQPISDLSTLDSDHTDQVHNYFPSGYQAYPQMIPCFWGNWPQAVSNNTNSTASWIAPSNDTQFPQLNGPICFGTAPWNWDNSMFNNANPWLNYLDPSMQSMLPLLQFPVMLGVPPQIDTSQSNEAMDYFQAQQMQNNAKS